MIKLVKYFRPYHFLLMALVIVLTWFSVSNDLKIPEKLGVILANIMIPGDEAKETIRNAGLQMLMFAGKSMAFTIVIALIASIVGAQYSNDLRAKVFKKVQSFSLTEIDEFQTASLITRTTNDVRQVQMVTIMILRMAVSAPLMAFRAVDKILTQSINLSLFVSGAVLFVIVTITLLFLIVLPKIKLIQKNTDRLNLITRENLTGLRVIRAYNAIDIEKDKFETANERTTKNNIFVNRMMSFMHPVMIFTLNFTSLSIVWFGIYLVNANTSGLNLENITMFQQYSMMVIIAFMQLTMIFIMIPRGSVSAKRINEVLKSENKITDKSNTLNTDEELGTIEFKDVTFRYENAPKPVLQNISFTINKGETVAIIGGTGSGKSTLVNLILRFFEVSSGSILVDGIDIKDYRQNDLRDKIGYIPQKGVLFSGTIRSNMLYGKHNATDEDIENALKISCASEFVNKLEQKYDYPISQGGTNVSGGQRQRLSIARAVIKDPEFYIFDDSFSALDYKTDLVVRNNLNEYTNKKTKIIVAQRIGTIIDASKIIVLEEGRICQIGTHKELLKTCEVYQEIAYSQLSKEELSYE